LTNHIPRLTEGPQPLASEFGSGPLMSKMPLFLQSRKIHIQNQDTLCRDVPKCPVLLNWFGDCDGLVAIYRNNCTWKDYFSAVSIPVERASKPTADRSPLLFHGTCRASGVYIRHHPRRQGTLCSWSAWAV